MARPIRGDRSRDAACTAGLMPATRNAPPIEHATTVAKFGATAATTEITA